MKMRTARRILLLPCVFAFLLIIFSTLAIAADKASIDTRIYPETTVADGNSVVTLTITVRDNRGALVPDNTQVLVEATQGTIADPILFTRGGTVQARFIAGRTVAPARITVSVLGFQATASYEIPLVKDRSQLRKSQESVTISAENRVTYSPEFRIIRADGPGKKVKLKYGNLELSADDLEFRIDTRTVLAKRATLKNKSEIWSVEELLLNVRTGDGWILTDSESVRVIVGQRKPFPEIEIVSGSRRGWQEIKGFARMPLGQAPAPELFQFTDLLSISTLIYAKKVEASLGRELYLQEASVDIAGNIVMRIPRMKVNEQTNTPIITDQYLQVGNNDLLIDFPYYLDLGLRGESLLRFKYGTRFSRGGGAAGGLFVNFEKNWQSGPEQRGGISLIGISRKDWGISARQSLLIGANTRAFLQADFPTHRTILGSSYIESRIESWRISHSLSGTKTIRGPRSASLDQSLGLTKDSVKLKILPVNFNYGLIWSTRESLTSDTDRITQQSYGANASLNYTSPFRNSGTTNAFLRLTKRWGKNVESGLTTSLSSSHSFSPSRGINFTLGYDFSDDPFNAKSIGKHRSTLSASLSKGRLDFNTFVSKSLDLDRLNVQIDANYRLSGLWRIGYGGTQDRYTGSNYTDQYISVLYKLGVREVGVSYSQRSKRFGFEIFSVGLR